MAIGGYSEDVVVRYISDPEKYLDGIDKVAKGIKKEERSHKQLELVMKQYERKAQEIVGKNRSLADSFKGVSDRLKGSGLVKAFQGLADVKAGIGMFTGAISGLYNAYDDFINRGIQYGRLLRANTLNIEEAAEATQGLITRQQLLEAANRSTQFNLGFTEKQFATLAKSAVIAAQAIGGDVNQAIGDLIRGIATKSKPILDNLAIKIEVLDVVYKKFAESIGKTSKELTEEEKSAAFLNATLKELERVSKAGEISTDSYGEAHVAAKNKLNDLLDEMAEYSAVSRSNSQESKIIVSDLRSMAEELDLVRDKWGKLIAAIKPVELTKIVSQTEIMAKAEKQMAESMKAKPSEELEKLRDKRIRQLANLKREQEQAARAATEADRKEVEAIQKKFDKERELYMMRYGYRAQAEELTKQQRQKELEGARGATGLLGEGEGPEKTKQDMMALEQELMDFRREQIMRFADEMSLKFQGMNFLEQIMPEESYYQFLERLRSMTPVVQGTFGEMMTGVTGFKDALADALFAMASTDKSAGDAAREAFGAWLAVWGKQMMLKSMEATGTALLKAAMWDWAGAGQAAAAAAAYGAAATAAGMASRGIIPTQEEKPKPRGAGIERGIGGPASTPQTQSSQPMTFVYNINTLLPPREEEAATLVFGLYRKGARLAGR